MKKRKKVSDAEKIKNYGVYFYTFPSLIKETEDYPIKIGVSVSGKHPSTRVQSQCTAWPEKPIILDIRFHSDAVHMEKYIHKSLKAKGKQKLDAGGTEWFITSIKEIMKYVIRFETRHPDKAALPVEEDWLDIEQPEPIKSNKDPYFDAWVKEHFDD